MEKFAIVKIGGKQHKVREGDILKVEKLKDANPGDKKVFDEVLLRSGDDKVEIGGPYLKAKVEVEVKSSGKGKKGVVFHYKPKKRYRKKTSYRPNYTEIKVVKIS